MMGNDELTEDQNYYFWLGADGELTPIDNEEEFEDYQNKYRKELDDWLNVRIMGNNDDEASNGD